MRNNRVLVIDDNEAIHRDFRRILQLGDDDSVGVDELAVELFGADTQNTADLIPPLVFDVDSAFQGRQGVEMVQRAVDEGNPYAVAFVDMRMPPGWDGIETTRRIWEADPDCEIVICTAYSDRGWDEIRDSLPQNDRFVILKKPFDAIEAQQLANALSGKWSIVREARDELKTLKAELEEKNASLAGGPQLIPAETTVNTKPLPLSAFHRISQPVDMIGKNLVVLDGHLQALVDETGTNLTAEQVDNAISLITESLDGIRRIQDIIRDSERHHTNQR